MCCFIDGRRQTGEKAHISLSVDRAGYVYRYSDMFIVRHSKQSQEALVIGLPKISLYICQKMTHKTAWRLQQIQIWATVQYHCKM